METKLPLISYVVKTQFVTNNAGLKTLYQKTFTDENILIARKKAMEYYKAAIEVLESLGEISKDEICGKIVYKNPDLFDKGIGVFMRLNQDYFKNGIADKANSMFPIDAHFSMNSREKSSLDFGKKTEQKYFDLLKLKREENAPIFVNSAMRLLKVAELQKLKKKTIEEAEFIPFQKKENDVELLLESVCAFMNTNGGTIIFGQDNEMKNVKPQNNIVDFQLIISRLLESVFSKNKENFSIEHKNLNGVEFLEIKITKSETECFYKNEYYFRNRFGNVMDLNRSWL